MSCMLTKPGLRAMYSAACSVLLALVSVNSRVQGAEPAADRTQAPNALLSAVNLPQPLQLTTGVLNSRPRHTVADGKNAAGCPVVASASKAAVANAFAMAGDLPRSCVISPKGF